MKGVIFSREAEPLLRGLLTPPHDPTFCGVIKRRNFQDVFFAIVFLLHLAGSGAISFIAFSKGDISILDLKTFSQGSIEASLSELRSQKWIFFGVFWVALVVGVLQVALLKVLAKFVVFMTILGTALFFGVGALYLLMNPPVESASLQYGCIVSLIASVVLLLCLFFLRNRISFVAAVFAETAKALDASLAIFLLGSLVLLGFVAYVGAWILMFMHLFTVPDGTQTFQYPQLQLNYQIRWLLVYQAFSAWWTSHFLFGVFEATVAGGVASWYFSRQMHLYFEDQPSTLFVFRMSMSKSFGSIALASLLISLLGFLHWIDRMTSKAYLENVVVRAILLPARVLVSIFSSVLKFVNKYAYIYIGMYGKSYCASTSAVFQLMSRNPFALVFSDLLGDLVLLFWEIAATASCTAGFYVACVHYEIPVTYLSLGVVAAIALITLHFFALIIGAGVDAMLVCYLEDLERNRDRNQLIMDNRLHSMVQQVMQHRKEQFEQ